MKYRAVGKVTFEDGRPMQTFGASLGPVREWAKEIATGNNIEVNIFVMEEKLLETIDQHGQIQVAITGGAKTSSE
jgi:hypothetical protein